MQARKELNLGFSDFKNIIENDNYFVDKSLLIIEVIKAEKAVLLLPRLRRFGKTLNLSASFIKAKSSCHFFLKNFFVTSV